MVRGAADRPDRHPSGTQRTCRTEPVRPARAEEKSRAVLGPDRSDAIGPVHLTRDEAAVLAETIAGSVLDPELPMVTIADLGILRGVTAEGGRVVVALTPTYSGCPAIAEMRADVGSRLAVAGFDDVEIRTVLSPPWSTDWITPAGRRKLAEAGIAPPAAGASRTGGAGPIPLTLTDAPPRGLACPACGSDETERTAAFGSTACKDLYRCRACAEPFEHIKEVV